jgi:hypothetical protein
MAWQGRDSDGMAGRDSDGMAGRDSDGIAGRDSDGMASSVSDGAVAVKRAGLARSAQLPSVAAAAPGDAATLSPVMSTGATGRS